MISQRIVQVFLAEKRDIFKKAVLIEYPRKGIYSVAFYTCESGGEIQNKMSAKMISVFVPTTPNPTSGYLLFVPEDEIIFLDMNIEDAIKLVISGGAVIPEMYTNKKIDSDKTVEQVSQTLSQS